MPRLNLRTKLLGTGLVLLAFTAAISALVHLHDLRGGRSRYDDLRRRHRAPRNTSASAHSQLGALDRQVLQALLAGTSISAADAAAIEEEAVELDATILGNEGDEGTLSDDESVVIEAYKADFAAYSAALHSVLELSSEGRASVASAAYSLDQAPAFAAVDADIKALIELAVADAKELDLALDATKASSPAIILLGLASALLVGMALMLWTSRSIVRGVQDVQRTLTSLTRWLCHLAV